MTKKDNPTGLAAHGAIKHKNNRKAAAWFGCILLILLSIGFSYQYLGNSSNLESSMPVTTVAEVPLIKRHLYGSDTIGRVTILEYDNFDNQPGDEIFVLSTNSISFLNPGTNEIRSTTRYLQQDCDGCVHMYPYVVPDGKGRFLISTSDGVSIPDGSLRWIAKAEGFNRVVPIQNHPGTPLFLTYQGTEHITLKDANGQPQWNIALPANTIGHYNTPDGKQLPFAITGFQQSRTLKIFNLDGSVHTTMNIPGWASNVEPIAWPSEGHLLIGAGTQVGILNGDGSEELRHIIKNTSFSPYHGPIGTAVKFNAKEAPYLATVSHGRSGIDHSVLLIFNPDGKLVWQEELRKLSSIIAVPKADGASERLLLGGRDGILEYTLAGKTIKKEAE